MFKNCNCSILAQSCEYSVNEMDGTITCTMTHGGRIIEETETMEKFLQGFPFYLKPSDAAFIAEWYPEFIYSAGDHWKYFPYSWMTFSVMSEDDLAKYLDYNGTSEDEYNEKYGTIIRDAGLSGVFVCGD